MKITFQNQEVTLKGKTLSIGDCMPSFRVHKNDLSELKLCNEKQVKVILSVPSIDTGVCDLEVSKFMENMKEFPKVLCMSVSLDLPFALNRWCQQKNNEAVITTSDYKYHEFAEATGTYVEELGLLTRAVFVLDQDNIVQHVEYVNEITTEPNYEAVLEILRKWNTNA